MCCFRHLLLGFLVGSLVALSFVGFFVSFCCCCRAFGAQFFADQHYGFVGFTGGFGDVCVFRVFALCWRANRLLELSAGLCRRVVAEACGDAGGWAGVERGRVRGRKAGGGCRGPTLVWQRALACRPLNSPAPSCLVRNRFEVSQLM